MRIRYGRLLAVLLLAACSDLSPSITAPGAAGPHLSVWGSDNDHDNLDDGTEWELANRFAPLLYMPKLITRAEADFIGGDWTWPATVDWYLPQVRMRIHHNNCSDHQLLDFGQVTPTNLLQQVHRRYVLGWLGCSHVDPYQYSDRDFNPDDHYFLQAGDDDAVHPGVRDPSRWKAYTHAYPNNLGGVTIQYWLFYAYNDGFSLQNHEGDWEHVDVKLDASYNPVTVYLSFHTSLNPYAPADMTWYGTHPQVWVADGSHANFRSEDVCNGTLREAGALVGGVAINESCWTNADQRWFTWAGGRGYDAGLQGAGLVDVGEKGSPTYGQEWIRYSGRWGEEGQSDETSGPQGPAYKADWLKDQYVAYTGGGTGGTGGTGDCTTQPMVYGSGGTTTLAAKLPATRRPRRPALQMVPICP